jgi:hypothetical protein
MSDRARADRTGPASGAKANNTDFHGDVEKSCSTKAETHREPDWAIRLRERIADPDREQAKAWCADTLKPGLAKRAGMAAESWLDVLHRIYAVGLTFAGRPAKDRKALLSAMGLRNSKKNLFLVLIHGFWRLPDERKERKTVQSRHSRWASALKGAALKRVSIADFPAVLQREGIDGLAKVAKAEARERTQASRLPDSETGGQARRKGIPLGQIGKRGEEAKEPPGRSTRAAGCTPRRKAPVRLARASVTSKSGCGIVPGLKVEAVLGLLAEPPRATGWYPALVHVEGLGKELILRLVHVGSLWSAQSSEPDIKQFDELTSSLTLG